MSVFLSIKSSISAILLFAFLFFFLLCLSEVIGIYHLYLVCFLYFTLCFIRSSKDMFLDSFSKHIVGRDFFKSYFDQFILFSFNLVT